MALNPLLSIDTLIDCLTAQAANLPTYKTEVGATTDDLDEIPKLLANLVAIRNFCELVEADKQTAFGIKNAMFRGKVGDPVAVAPTFPTLSLPFPPALSGAREITLNRNKRFTLGPAYSVEIGEALMIEAPTPSSISPDEVKPEIHLFGAATNHHFSCVVEKRADSDMWQLWIQRKGGEWELYGTYTGKSVDVSVPLTTPGEPEQLLARVQLRRKNENYGQPSNPAYVTLNP